MLHAITIYGHNYIGHNYICHDYICRDDRFTLMLQAIDVEADTYENKSDMVLPNRKTNTGPLGFSLLSTGGGGGKLYAFAGRAPSGATSCDDGEDSACETAVMEYDPVADVWRLAEPIWSKQDERSAYMWPVAVMASYNVSGNVPHSPKNVLIFDLANDITKGQRLKYVKFTLPTTGVFERITNPSCEQGGEADVPSWRLWGRGNVSCSPVQNAPSGDKVFKFMTNNAEAIACQNFVVDPSVGLFMPGLSISTTAWVATGGSTGSGTVASMSLEFYSSSQRDSYGFLDVGMLLSEVTHLIHTPDLSLFKWYTFSTLVHEQTKAVQFCIRASSTAQSTVYFDYISVFPTPITHYYFSPVPSGTVGAEDGSLDEPYGSYASAERYLRNDDMLFLFPGRYTTSYNLQTQSTRLSFFGLSPPVENKRLGRPQALSSFDCLNQVYSYGLYIYGLF